MQDIETTDEEILSLFLHDGIELDRIESESKVEKKKIVQHLAKDLEGKLSPKTITLK